MTLPAGTRLGPHEIDGPIGSGGMGEVYRARDVRLDRVVAGQRFLLLSLADRNATPIVAILNWHGLLRH